jgi:hypothetical protein
MTDDQIKHMVGRFLAWRLPEGFNPDAGISFEPVANAGTPYEHRHQPVGTNLLDAQQAELMVRHMIEGLATCRCRGTFTQYGMCERCGADAQPGQVAA